MALHDFQEVRLDFEVVPRLAADPATGKFRRMVSLVGRPEGPSVNGDGDAIGSGPMPSHGAATGSA